MLGKFPLERPKVDGKTKLDLWKTAFDVDKLTVVALENLSVAQKMSTGKTEK